MSGSPTGDLHPICNAPMLGAHKAIEVNRRQSARFGLALWHGPEPQGVAASLRRSPHRRRSQYSRGTQTGCILRPVATADRGREAPKYCMPDRRETLKPGTRNEKIGTINRPGGRDSALGELRLRPVARSRLTKYHGTGSLIEEGMRTGSMNANHAIERNRPQSSRFGLTRWHGPDRHRIETPLRRSAYRTRWA